MPVVELPGVSMWYDKRGQGDFCVLLHPAVPGIDSRALEPTLDGLARVFRCYTPEQRAHDRTPDADGPVSCELMAGDTIALCPAPSGLTVAVAPCCSRSSPRVARFIQRRAWNSRP